MDIQNHYYGHSGVLAAYAGLKRVRHIDGLLQHGWTVLSPSRVHFMDFPRLPPGAKRLVWTHSSRGWSPDRDPFRTVPVGSPWLYLDQLAKDDARPEPSGTVVFPVHGTRLVKADSSEDEFAREIARREGPATVSLHVEDLDDPNRIAAWARHGHRVVSAGGRRDPLFLGRIRHLILSAEHVVSNQLSTAVIYAASLGTRVSLYGSDVSFASEGSRAADRTRELWPEFYDGATTDELQQIALVELGADHLHSPRELRTVLGWERHSVRPVTSYWAGAPLRKAAAVLGIAKRAEGTQIAESSLPASHWLRHPLSHLPGRLPAALPFELAGGTWTPPPRMPGSA